MSNPQCHVWFERIPLNKVPFIDELIPQKKTIIIYNVADVLWDDECLASDDIWRMYKSQFALNLLSTHIVYLSCLLRPSFFFFSRRWKGEWFLLKHLHLDLLGSLWVALFCIRMSKSWDFILLIFKSLMIAFRWMFDPKPLCSLIHFIIWKKLE